MLTDIARSVAQMPANEATWIAAILAVMGLAGLLWWWVTLQRGQLMANTPTSRIRSAAQGFVELDGTGHWLPDDRIHAPLTGRSCVWWEYAIHERRTTTSSKGRRTYWAQIASGRSEEIFLLQDGTGDIVVDPHGAVIFGYASSTWKGHSPRPSAPPASGFSLQFGRYRYRERRLELGADLYALGWLQTETAEADTQDHRAEVAEWLRELKADQRRLLREFDANRDGEVDAIEWEAARQKAIAEIDARLLERSLAPGVSVLKKPPDGRIFILSGHDEQTLRRKLLIRACTAFSLFVLGSTGALFIALVRGWIGA